MQTDELSEKKLVPNVEALVYLVISPSEGPEHRIYCEEDLHAIGGVHALERKLETQSYWFCCLGQIIGKRDSGDDMFSDEAFAQLPEPDEDALQIGRLNPAFARTEIEKRIFREIFRALERELDLWKYNDGGTVEAYALKELKIGAHRLASMTTGLLSLRRAHELLEISVVKFWYDPQWQAKPLPSDLVLAEFSFRVPVQIEWARGERLISVQLMLGASC